MIGKTIAELQAGDRAEITRVVGDGDIAGFVGAVGDYNPVHSDPAYAAGTVFQTPIAPGIFTAGLISAVIGTTLPGPGAIYPCRRRNHRARGSVRSDQGPQSRSHADGLREPAW